MSDFKPTKDHSYLAGGAGEFLRVGENGELKADTPKTELLPQRQIDTFGRQFSMTRQAFINDDVGFITEMPGLYAMSAKRTRCPVCTRPPPSARSTSRFTRS